MDIKKIIKEELNDWGWTQETNMMRGYLDAYVNGEIHFTSWGNFAHRMGLYEIMGEYLISEKGREPFRPLPTDRMKRERVLGFESINYFTSDLDEKVLREAFGTPVNHDEFGEGFDDYEDGTSEYDEEGVATQDIRDYSFSSWFVELNGVVFHLGRDHRGTTIEIQSENRSPIDSDEDIIGAFKELIDRTIEYVN
jgi:hypothetical protein